MLLGEYSKGAWQLDTRIPDAPYRTFLVLFCDLWKIGLVFYFPGIREREEKKGGGKNRKSLRCQESIICQTLYLLPLKTVTLTQIFMPLIHLCYYCLNLSLFFWPHLTFQGGIFWFSSLSMALPIDIKLLEYRYIYLCLFCLIWMLIK